MVFQKKPIRKLLIANRGEIASRLLRTSRRLGINTALVYTKADANTSPVNLADEAVCIGDAREYLEIEKIIFAAKSVRADAIHPGFGFLSENADFARRCEEEGLIFVGPSAASIAAMGSKSEAKKFLSQAKYAASIPIIPGYHGENQDEAVFATEARKIGYPVLLKASAGGGGKGMRIVHDEKDLVASIQSARREAHDNFGSDRLLIEKYFFSVRHVEIQIFGDASAQVIHLGERDCSVQRRHQKVIEESPSPQFTRLGNEGDSLRQHMGRVAVSIGEAIQYKNAGTVEFILDEHNNFYFLEVNTRLQVEHPVTELLTGLDLVELQIRVAEGYTFSELGISQSTIKHNGHAIQCRLYAEDPLNDFLPAPGKLIKWIPAEVEHVRFDSGIQSGSEISMYFDPMVAKIIAWGPDRRTAIQRLRETIIVGLVTNAQFLLQVLDHEIFAAGRANTHFIQNHLPAPEVLRLLTAPLPDDIVTEVVVAATCFLFEANQQTRSLWRNVSPNFRNVFHRPEFKEFVITEREVKVEYAVVQRPHKEALLDSSVQFRMSVLGKEHSVGLDRVAAIELSHNPSHHTVSGRVFVVLNGRKTSYFAHHNSASGDVFLHSALIGRVIRVRLQPRLFLPQGEGESSANVVSAPMTGKIVSINVVPGQAVSRGTILCVMESMKMETRIHSLREGVIDEVMAKSGTIIEEGKSILTYQRSLTPSTPVRKPRIPLQ